MENRFHQVIAVCLKTIVVLSICLVAQSGVPLVDTIYAQALPAISAIKWSPTGDLIATGHRDGSIRIWHATASEPYLILNGHSDEITSLAWKSDETQVVSGSFDGTARVWNFNNGQELAVFSNLSSVAVLAVSWTLDNSKIVAIPGNSNPDISVWDATTFSPLPPGPRLGDTLEILWDSENTVAALVNIAGQVILADPNTFDPLVYLDEPDLPDGGRYGVYSAAWSPDGTLIASGNYAGVIRIWDVASEQVVQVLEGSDSTEVDWTITPVRALRFDPTGTQLMSLTTDGTYRVWDVETGGLISTEHIPNEPIYAAAWSPDGSKFAYGGEGGTPEIVTSDAPD